MIRISDNMMRISAESSGPYCQPLISSVESKDNLKSKRTGSLTNI
jgi:hypothetical protein